MYIKLVTNCNTTCNWKLISNITLQVLFHAALTSDGSQPSAAGVEATFCATASLLHSDGQRRLQSATCSLTVRSVVCLATVGVPASWWHPRRSDTVQVSCR